MLDVRVVSAAGSVEYATGPSALGAGVIGAVVAGYSPSIGAAIGAAVAAALAFDAHAAKASTRLVINTSPEPVSNVAVSVFEDVSVAGLILLALKYPVVAVVVVVVLTVGATALTVWLWKLARRAIRRVAGAFTLHSNTRSNGVD